MPKSFRYTAFVSYAHEDEAFATWLHRRLERFVIPRTLRRATGARRLGAFFRDRDELASGGSLSERIIAALRNSEHLVVVCSAASARSPWVNREIEMFAEVRSLDGILLVVADSVPAGGIPLPNVLRSAGELLAADARAGSDGRERAFLKIVAGLLDVPLDAIVQRARVRRRRQRLLMGSCALALLVGSAATWWLVDTASREAAARRQQAGVFVSAFVNDLQARVAEYETVGTLDADLEKALEFFATLPPDELDEATLHDYRTALLGIGMVRIRQGKPQQALEVFNRALELSQSLVDRDAEDPEHWYDLAVHTYYIGEAYWEMQEFPAATARIVESLQYAERAAALAPENFAYQIEVVYGLNNIGAVRTRSRDYTGAVEALERSVARIRDLREGHPEYEVDLLNQEVEAVSWLAEIAQARREYAAAFERHEREVSLRKRLIELTDNPHHVGRLSDALGYMAQSLMATGEAERAVAVLNEQLATAQRALDTDPENAFFRERLLIGQAVLANALYDNGDVMAARDALDAAEAGMQSMLTNDEQATAIQRDLAYVASTRAYFALESDAAAAHEIANTAMTTMTKELDRVRIDPILLNYYVRCAIVLAAAERRLGRTTSELVADAYLLMDGQLEPESSSTSASRVLLLHALGRSPEAIPIAQNLADSGFDAVMYRKLLGILAPTGS